MDEYLGKSYQGDVSWTYAQLSRWRKTKCPEGAHLFDEVLSITSHYLYCDACGYSTDDLTVTVVVEEPV